MTTTLERRRRYCERGVCPTCGAAAGVACPAGGPNAAGNVCVSRAREAARRAVATLKASDGVVYDNASAVDEAEIRLSEPHRRSLHEPLASAARVEDDERRGQ